MRITELFNIQSIALDSAAADQAQIIDELVELQATHGNLTDKVAYLSLIHIYPKRWKWRCGRSFPRRRAVISATGWWTMAAPCAPHAPHRIVSAAACGMCAAMRMKKAKRTEPGNAPHHTTPFICLLFYKTLGFWLWGML